MAAAASVTLALAGDTMLGRGVAARLADDPRAPLLAPEIVEAAATADRFVLNLECCISERGERFPDPHKPFFFRAPPVAAERLAAAGVDAVSLANNHALDYGADALLDTLTHLEAAGIASVGAGADVVAARQALDDAVGGARLRLVAFTDHPAYYAAGAAQPGVAFAAPDAEPVPPWVAAAVEPGVVSVVMAHWGPNMQPEPVRRVRRAAAALTAAGASLVAGHSAHVFQGVAGPVLFDLGDFVDDYAVDSQLRNDLGLLWLVTLDEHGPRRIEALPLRLDFCFTRVATGDDAAWIARRLAGACAAMGTEVRPEGSRLVVSVGP